MALAHWGFANDGLLASDVFDFLESRLGWRREERRIFCCSAMAAPPPPPPPKKKKEKENELPPHIPRGLGCLFLLSFSLRPRAWAVPLLHGTKSFRRALVSDSIAGFNSLCGIHFSLFFFKGNLIADLASAVK
jgi:hypothetical protein